MTNPVPDIPDSSDVVIIGAGIAGISTAWYLNQAGVQVTVCEKGRIAGEQSSRNWGWIRQQGRDRDELPIVMQSMQLWQDIADQLDEDIGYRREGSLYLCENDAEMANHDRFMSFAPDFGASTRRINRKQIDQLVRDCPSRWQSGLYTPDDGRAEPSIAVPAMARALAAKGVHIIENCAVEEILVSARQIRGVRTEYGEIGSSTILCAGGAWSSQLLKPCGIRLPQLSVKATVARTAPAPLLFNGNLAGSKVSLRRRLDGGYTVASSDYLEVFPSTTQLAFMADFMPLIRSSWRKIRLRYPEFDMQDGFRQHRVLDPIPTRKTLARIKARLADRVPALANIELQETWSGMIDATPDVVPVLDRAGAVEGLWIATGFSGHGFGIGPGAGKIMADLMQGNPVQHPLSRFRFERFTDGSPLVLGPAL